MACLRCRFKKRLSNATDPGAFLTRASRELDWQEGEIRCWLEKKGCAPPKGLRERIEAFLERIESS